MSILRNSILLAGVAQIALVAGSLSIPSILKWKVELAKVRPLIKQMFWTYAAYILVINFCFGLISVCCGGELLNRSTLAMLITGFIAVYWISRIAIQFFYFDRTGFPKGRWYAAGETILICLFTALSAAYSWAFFYNLNY